MNGIDRKVWKSNISSKISLWLHFAPCQAAPCVPKYGIFTASEQACSACCCCVRQVVSKRPAPSSQQNRERNSPLWIGSSSQLAAAENEWPYSAHLLCNFEQSQGLMRWHHTEGNSSYYSSWPTMPALPTGKQFSAKNLIFIWQWPLEYPCVEITRTVNFPRTKKSHANNFRVGTRDRTDTQPLVYPCCFIYVPPQTLTSYVALYPGFWKHKYKVVFT